LSKSILKTKKNPMTPVIYKVVHNYDVWRRRRRRRRKKRSENRRRNKKSSSCRKKRSHTSKAPCPSNSTSGSNKKKISKKGRKPRSKASFRRWFIASKQVGSFILIFAKRI
jgi:hypothetical protein